VPPHPPGRPLCDRYRAIRLLRRGLALDVFDAWSEERDCRCIAKVVRNDRLQDRDARAALYLEGKLLLQLTHPHLVRAYEIVRRPRPILVLETLGGATVSRLLREHPRGFPPEDVLLLGRHLSSALAYLHSTGYVHLDLKPSNVIAADGVAKLIDLSVAARVGQRLRGVGTPRYRSPEQLAGLRLTPAADVWGLGCLLYEAATGTAAFAKLWRRRFEELGSRPPPLRKTSRLPRAAAEAIDACLSVSAAERPALGDVSATLRAAL
jgi:eukaryotic-like serine/threonine-protein kinase